MGAGNIAGTGNKVAHSEFNIDITKEVREGLVECAANDVALESLNSMYVTKAGRPMPDEMSRSVPCCVSLRS